MVRNIKFLSLSALLSLGILTAAADTNVSTGDWDDNWGGSTPGFGVSFVANPTGTFTDLRLALASPDPDAAIYWTVRKGATIGDGAEWTLYTAPITFTGDATVSYYASRGLGENSEMQQFSLVYADYQTAAPTVSLGADGESIAITAAEEGTTLRYTTDGSDPNETSAVYTAPIALRPGRTTVKARAFKAGFFPSEVAQHSEVRGIEPPSAKVENLSVVLTVGLDNAKIYWTESASALPEETSAWTLYTAPVAMTEAERTLRFFTALADGQNSAVESFTFDPAAYKAAAPEIRFTADKTGIEILSEVAGAEIRFTTDGTDPDEASAAYYSALDLEEGSHTVKARVFAPGMFASAVVRFDYTHNPQSGNDPVSALESINADSEAALALATEGGQPGLVAAAPASVGIYTLSGACVATLDLAPGFNPLPSLEHGLYIVAGFKVVF